MLKKLFTQAPLIAVLGATIVFVIVASAGMGLEWPLLVAVAAGIFAVAEGWVIWVTVRQRNQIERHLRHIRFIADRFQSMVRSAPNGYCLFHAARLLREEQGAAERLGIEKLSHMDDLIGAVREGAELLEAFRKLQVTGDPFEMEVRTAKDGKLVPITGRRFRIGGDGPHVDVLWFCDSVAKGASLAKASAKAPEVKTVTASVPKRKKRQICR
jgi:hypothetical protein